MRIVRSLAILAAVSGWLVAQDAKLQFEVATARLSGPAQPGALLGLRAQGGPGTSDSEHLTYERVAFQQLLMDAYGVQRDQIQGPEWATTNAGTTSVLFDIGAKVPAGTTKAQAAIMLQNLLKERFQLALHHETVELPGLALVAAKRGPKLKESSGPLLDSERREAVAGPVKLETEKDGFPELFPGRNMGGTFQNGTARMRFRDYPVSDLVQQFSFALAVHLLDRTGLNGKYDFTLEFTPPEDGFLVAMYAILPLAPGQKSPLNKEGPDPAREGSVPAVSSAMEKQLGLRLERTKITVDTLVIDHVEKIPAEN